jgi:hypothetical protein
MTFSEAIKGKSAKQLEAVLGCKLSTCYDYLSGRRKPPQHVAGLLAEKIKASNTKSASKKRVASRS